MFKLSKNKTDKLQNKIFFKKFKIFISISVNNPLKTGKTQHLKMQWNDLEEWRL